MTQQKIYHFEPVEKSWRRVYEPAISLSSNVFRFNSALTQERSLAKYPYLMVYFDRSAMAVGFRFVKKPDKGTWKVNFRNHRASVTLHSFFRAEKLDCAVFAGVYTPQIYEDPSLGQMMVITLQENKKTK